MAVFYGILAVVGILLGIYVYSFLTRTLGFYGAPVKRAWIRILIILVSAVIAWRCMNLRQTSAMVLLHFVIFAMVFDLAALIGKGIFRWLKKERAGVIWRKIFGCGLLPLAAATGLLIYGFFNMNRVVQTEYEVETEKQVGDYQIVLITDTHYGTIQDKSLLKNKISEISAQDPYLVILGGDIVEEGTSKADMEEVFQVLSGIESRYGIYYVYGNHDRQPYTEERTYTEEELSQAITKNGITILEDSYVEIGDDLILAGRGDAAWGNSSGRASIEELLEGADREKYIVVADHQPVEAQKNGKAGVDLELSGHTHGGQIFPVGVISQLTGTLNYGEYEKEGCRVIVSSGFTGWGYPIRTEKHCEYAVIHIESEKD